MSLSNTPWGGGGGGGGRVSFCFLQEMSTTPRTNDHKCLRIRLGFDKA